MYFFCLFFIKIISKLVTQDAHVIISCSYGSFDSITYVGLLTQCVPTTMAVMADNALVFLRFSKDAK